MRIRTSIRHSALRIPRSSESGGILIFTVIFCTLVGIVLVAYLSMVRTQHRFTHRAQTWNSCVALCEAGIEEAMAHINHVNTTSNFAVNGWALSGGAYRKQRTLNGGIVRMAINTAMPPTIRVDGFLRAPLQTNFITRSVQVQTRLNRTFPNAFLAKGSIQMGGNGPRIDSFNSTNVLESTFGQYDPLKATDRATVTTVSTASGAVSVGNVSVYGYVSTGAGGTVSVNNNGNVGSTLWNNNPVYDGKIEPGHVKDDANVYIPDATPPLSFAPVVPTGGTVNGTNYTYILGNGDYTLPSINMSSGAILITGKARLHVTGSTSISSTAFVELGSNGSIEWYQSGSFSIAGKGVVNSPGLAQNCSVIGLPGCTKVDYSGQAKFVGTVYAPGAAVTISGIADACGALVGNTISVSGGMNFHYDEALVGNPTRGRYVASSWQEI